MTKLRYFLRLVFAYIKRFKTIIFLSILFGVLAFLLVRVVTKYFIVPTERIGVTGRYHSENLPVAILSLLSDGLTKIDEDNVVLPAIAHSWETPDNGKTWEPMKIIVSDEKKAIQNPVAIVDKSSNIIHFLYCFHYKRVYYMF